MAILCYVMLVYQRVVMVRWIGVNYCTIIHYLLLYYCRSNMVKHLRPKSSSQMFIPILLFDCWWSPTSKIAAKMGDFAMPVVERVDHILVEPGQLWLIAANTFFPGVVGPATSFYLLQYRHLWISMNIYESQFGDSFAYPIWLVVWLPSILFSH